MPLSDEEKSSKSGDSTRRKILPSPTDSQIDPLEVAGGSKIGDNVFGTPSTLVDDISPPSKVVETATQGAQTDYQDTHLKVPAPNKLRKPRVPRKPVGETSKAPGVIVEDDRSSVASTRTQQSGAGIVDPIPSPQHPLGEMPLLNFPEGEDLSAAIHARVLDYLQARGNLPEDQQSNISQNSQRTGDIPPRALDNPRLTQNPLLNNQAPCFAPQNQALNNQAPYFVPPNQAQNNQVQYFAPPNQAPNNQAPYHAPYQAPYPAAYPASYQSSISSPISSSLPSSVSGYVSSPLSGSISSSAPCSV